MYSNIISFSFWQHEDILQADQSNIDRFMPCDNTVKHIQDLSKDLRYI